MSVNGGNVRAANRRFVVNVARERDSRLLGTVTAVSLLSLREYQRRSTLSRGECFPALHFRPLSRGHIRRFVNRKIAPFPCDHEPVVSPYLSTAFDTAKEYRPGNQDGRGERTWLTCATCNPEIDCLIFALIRLSLGQVWDSVFMRRPVESRHRGSFRYSCGDFIGYEDTRVLGNES